MFVIAIAQIKGGVGKTTLAVNLAGEMTNQGWSVTLVDTDPQRCAMQWAAPQRLEFTVKQETFNPRFPALWVRNVLKVPSDVVIIDLPAGLSPAFETVMLISDLVIIPCGPSSLDINSAKMTLQKARETVRVDPSMFLNFAFVPTRVDLDDEEGQQISQELVGLGGAVTPHLSYDATYVRSFAAGATVGTFATKSPADTEMKALTNFLVQLATERQGVRLGM